MSVRRFSIIPPFFICSNAADCALRQRHPRNEHQRVAADGLRRFDGRVPALSKWRCGGTRSIQRRFLGTSASGAVHAHAVGIPEALGRRRQTIPLLDAQQEPGVRPSTALPYELAATGAVSADGKRFEISLESGHAVGAPFHVYTPGTFRGDPKLRTRAYAVSAGDRLTDSWELAGFENGRYHLCVCGPNGFLREFAGHATQSQLHVDCKYGSGDIELHFVNQSQQVLTFDMKDHLPKWRSHRCTPTTRPADARLALATNHHWYDVSVTIADLNGFLRRFAGRVETGKAGFSDPAIGRAVT